MKNRHLLIPVFLLFFSFLEVRAGTAVTLQDAVEQELVEVTIRGEEDMDFYGECLYIRIVSQSDKTLEIEIKCGLKLICKNEKVQNMVITETIIITLEPGEEDIRNLHAMCGELHDDPPSEEDYFRVGEMTTGNTLRIAEHIHQEDAQDIVGQYAMWATTDDASSRELGVFGINEDEVYAAVDLLNAAEVEVRLNTEPVEILEPGAEVDAWAKTIDFEQVIFLIGFWVVMGIAGISFLVALFRRRKRLG